MKVSDVPMTGFVAELGLRLLEVSPDRVVGELPVSDRLRNAVGALHHGAVSSVVETVASIAAAAWFEGRGQVVGISNTTRVHEEVREGLLSVVAEPVMRSDQRQQWNVQVWAADRLIASGQVELVNGPHLGAPA